MIPYVEGCNLPKEVKEELFKCNDIRETIIVIDCSNKSFPILYAYLVNIGYEKYSDDCGKIRIAINNVRADMTDDIKKYLKDLYPGEIFKRRSKVIDSLRYTHHVFESKDRLIVITTNTGEDWEITDSVIVEKIPSKADLKNSIRPWISGGPLSGYVFYPLLEDKYVYIWERSIWDNEHCISDSQGKDLFIEKITGGFSLMESCYEFIGNLDDVIKKLESLGASKVLLDSEISS